MTEAFLQYVWQHQLMRLDTLCTTDNEPISVIKIGTFNANAGPDFLNAKIKIGDTVWAGDVEVHVRASDWNIHKHQLQKSYNSVILHVVQICDKDVFNEQNQHVPTLVMPILPHVTHNYMKLTDIPLGIRCGRHLSSIDSVRISLFLERLVAERFENKAKHIVELYTKTNNDWEETLYQLLARNLGFKTNAEAFELLAKSLPLHLIEKHHDGLFQLEALLFGQANLLTQSNDEYCSRLLHEYQFLQKKYDLTPISSTWWKFAKMRPYNFPTIRIAQFARLLYNTHHLVSILVEINSLDEIYSVFSCMASEYWETHYSFKKESPKHSSELGRQAIETILINTVIPFLFAYGKERNNEVLTQRAYQFLMQISAEKNAIISQWKDYAIMPQNAFESQGLLQLFNEYCSKGNCVRCCIGHVVMNKIDN